MQEVGGVVVSNTASHAGGRGVVVSNPASYAGGRGVVVSTPRSADPREVR